MLAVLALLAACGTEPDAGAADSAGLADSASDAGDSASDTADSAGCATMSSGDDWAWNGECPQMRTPCEIVVDACNLTIGYSSGMTMGMPYAGTIDGDTITFEDGDYVAGCVGTLESADRVTGTCADGCTFTLRR